MITKKIFALSFTLFVANFIPTIGYASIILWDESVNGDIPDFNDFGTLGTGEYVLRLTSQLETDSAGNIISRDVDPFLFDIGPTHLLLSVNSYVTSSINFGPGFVFTAISYNLRADGISVYDQQHGSNPSVFNDTLPHAGDASFFYQPGFSYNSFLGASSGSVSHDFAFAISGVSTVPVPAAVWLFGTALIGLIGFGKRKKAV